MKAHEPDAAAIRRALTQASAEFRRLNPAIYGDAGALAGLRAAVAKPRQRREGENRGVESGGAGMAYRVTLIQCRRRLLDSHDNARAACKKTVDLICEWLGFTSDADPRLTWDYAQHKTAGRQGVVVIIECLS